MREIFSSHVSKDVPGEFRQFGIRRMAKHTNKLDAFLDAVSDRVGYETGVELRRVSPEYIPGQFGRLLGVTLVQGKELAAIKLSKSSTTTDLLEEIETAVPSLGRPLTTSFEKLQLAHTSAGDEVYFVVKSVVPPHATQSKLDKETVSVRRAIEDAVRVDRADRQLHWSKHRIDMTVAYASTLLSGATIGMTKQAINDALLNGQIPVTFDAAVVPDLGLQFT